MTHSLHRTGNAVALKSDYAILAMRAAGIHDTTPEQKQITREKLLRIGDILNQHQPTNIMNPRLQRFSPVITASYDGVEAVKAVLQTLKQEDLGLSIVVSGLIREIQRIAKEIELTPHTIHLSLGVFGKKKRELLPSDEILEITTQCGHHCVSPQLVEYQIDQIKQGKFSIEEAAQALAKPCVCGLVNPTRVRQILQKLL
jgi:hypothetical protein